MPVAGDPALPPVLQPVAVRLNNYQQVLVAIERRSEVGKVVLKGLRRIPFSASQNDHSSDGSLGELPAELLVVRYQNPLAVAGSNH